MKSKIGVVIGAILLVACCITMLQAQSTEKPKDAASVTQDYGTLINNSCTACHGLKKICGQIGKTDEKEWKNIVTRMAKKAKSKNITLTDADQTGMITYLSSLKDSKTLCTK